MQARETIDEVKSGQGGRLLLLLVLAAFLVLTAIGLLRRGPEEETSIAQVAVLVAACACILCIGFAEVLRLRRCAAAPGVKLVLRLLIYVCVLSSALWFIIYPQFEFAAFMAFFASTGAVLALLVFLSLPGKNILPGSLLSAFDVVLFNLCLGAVFLEVGLRVTAALSTAPLFARTQNSMIETIQRHRHAPGTPIFGFPCDSRGFHDHELAPESGKRLIVSIGDSFGVGVVPHYYHYTTVCERELEDFEIYNMGINAVGPAEYLHLMQTEALPLDPDLIIVTIFVGNDIAQAIKKPEHHAWLRSMFDRENLLAFLLPQRLLRLSAVGDIAPPWSGKDGDAPLTLIQTPEELMAKYPWLADPMKETPPFAGAAYFEMKMLMLRMVCRSDAKGIYEGIFEVLAEMKRISGTKPLLVVLLPDEFQVEENMLRAHFNTSEDGGKFSLDQPQRLLSKWLGTMGIDSLDLLPHFRAVAPLEDGERHLYHKQDTHFNVRGNAVAGRAIAEWLQEHVR